MHISEVLKQSFGRWSPDGRLIAGAAANRALIRDAETLKLVQVFVCLDRIERIEWSPDSVYIITQVAKLGVLQIWCVRDGEWRCRIDEGLAGISHARWGQTSQHALVVSDFQLYLAVWPLEDSGSPIRIRFPKFASRGVAFSRVQSQDGMGGRFAILRRTDCRDFVSTHSCQDGFAQLAEFRVAGDCADLAWAPGDLALILWELPCRASRLFWYTPQGELLAQVECGMLRSAFPSPSANLLAAGCFDGTLRLVSGSERQAVAHLVHSSAAAHAEAGDVDVFREQFDAESGTIRYARLASLAALQIPEHASPTEPPLDTEGIPQQGISHVAWSPDERYVATKHDGMPTAAWIWDLSRVALAALLVHRSPVRFLAWDPSAGAHGPSSGITRLAIVTEDSTMFLWWPGGAMATPHQLGAARPRWQSHGLAILLQDRDRMCVCTPSLGIAGRMP